MRYVSSRMYRHFFTSVEHKKDINKFVFILRGLPGSGKTRIATIISQMSINNLSNFMWTCHPCIRVVSPITYFNHAFMRNITGYNTKMSFKKSLPIGTLVTLKGLNTYSQYNGKIATICTPYNSKKKQYQIQLPGTGNIFNIHLNCIDFMRTLENHHLSSNKACIIPHRSIVCSADSYFTNKNGHYDYNSSFIKEAHALCTYSFIKAVTNGYSCICVDNTNSTKIEYQHYIDVALRFNYHVEILEMLCHNKASALTFNMRNIHDVPKHATIRMWNRWEWDPHAIFLESIESSDLNNYQTS